MTPADIHAARILALEAKSERVRTLDTLLKALAALIEPRAPTPHDLEVVTATWHDGKAHFEIMPLDMFMIRQRSSFLWGKNETRTVLGIVPAGTGKTVVAAMAGAAGVEEKDWL